MGPQERWPERAEGQVCARLSAVLGNTANLHFPLEEQVVTSNVFRR